MKNASSGTYSMGRFISLSEVKEKEFSVVFDTGALIAIRSKRDQARKLLEAIPKASRFTTFFNVLEFCDGEGRTKQRAKDARGWVKAQVSEILGVPWTDAFDTMCDYRYLKPPLSIGDAFTATAALRSKRVLVTADVDDFRPIERLLMLEGWG